MSGISRTLQPLKGLRVLDFSNYLPGPLATLMLAQAGAEVLKVEPPGGDPMRGLYADSDRRESMFEVLNRGKRSLCVDLKNADERAFINNLLSNTDILVEQFRPGVMARFSLEYHNVRQLKADIIYCSISGYGQHGSRAQKAGHDLNYQAEAGLLALVESSGGEPALPATLLGDIAAGSYPAVTNILLAVLQRQISGRGVRLDISMADNLSPFLFWALPGLSRGENQDVAQGPFTGGSPRYQLYKTVDDRWLAAAPLEEPFWVRFCELIGLEESLCAIDADAQSCITGVRERIGCKTAAYWMSMFEGEDVCCSLIDLPIPTNPSTDSTPALRTVIDPRFSIELAAAPRLGEANRHYGL